MSTESSLDMVFLTLSWMGSLVLRGLERGYLLFTKLTVTEKPRWSSRKKPLWRRQLTIFYFETNLDLQKRK